MLEELDHSMGIIGIRGNGVRDLFGRLVDWQWLFTKDAFLGEGCEVTKMGLLEIGFTISSADIVS